MFFKLLTGFLAITSAFVGGFATNLPPVTNGQQSSQYPPVNQVLTTGQQESQHLPLNKVLTNFNSETELTSRQKHIENCGKLYRKDTSHCDIGSRRGVCVCVNDHSNELADVSDNQLSSIRTSLGFLSNQCYNKERTFSQMLKYDQLGCEEKCYDITSDQCPEECDTIVADLETKCDTVSYNRAKDSVLVKRQHNKDRFELRWFHYVMIAFGGFMVFVFLFTFCALWTLGRFHREDTLPY